MAEGTGESKLAYMAICLKIKQLQLNWAGSYGDQGYVGGAAEIKKRGKCFHTGNMGFPRGWDWKSGNSKVLFKDECPLKTPAPNPADGHYSITDG
jgi:hypothetical protein